MPTNPFEYIWPGIIAAQAIYAPTKLRIPDLLASGPKTVAELASDCGAHPATLERLLRVLASVEMFALEPVPRQNSELSINQEHASSHEVRHPQGGLAV
jgi:hypothetical protein